LDYTGIRTWSSASRLFIQFYCGHLDQWVDVEGIQPFQLLRVAHFSQCNESTYMLGLLLQNLMISKMDLKSSDFIPVWSSFIMYSLNSRKMVSRLYVLG